MGGPSDAYRRGSRAQGNEAFYTNLGGVEDLKGTPGYFKKTTYDATREGKKLNERTEYFGIDPATGFRQSLTASSIEILQQNEANLTKEPEPTTTSTAQDAATKTGSAEVADTSTTVGAEPTRRGGVPQSPLVSLGSVAFKTILGG